MRFRPAPLALHIALIAAASPTLAATTHIDSATTATQLLGGEDTLSIDAGGSITASGKAVDLKGATQGSGATLDNAGVLRSTTGRAIDSSGSGDGRLYTLINREGALIDGERQAIRIDDDFVGTQVNIDNAGTIVSQTDRAIMLKALQSDVAIQITNRETGVIHGFDDGMRLGANASVINYGEISSSDMTDADAKYDGIDFDESSGGVVENHGLISGGRHGITTDLGARLTNYADGVVIGRNGSGFGSDGDGQVLNYGRITGAHSGLVADGDGDGVDIDGQGVIENYGIIEGIGAGGEKDGSANTSEGIAMGGGSILNHTGAVISGAANGILIDDSDTGGAPYALQLENYGSIYGLDGDAVRIIGEQDDAVINGGLISASGGVALDLGGGADTLALKSGSRFVGLVEGGEGRDQLILDDADGGSFGNSQHFEWLSLRQGTWTLDSDDFSEGGEVLAGELVNLGRINGSLQVARGATYSGSGEVAALDLARGAVLALSLDADAASTLHVAGQAQIDGSLLQLRAASGDYAWQTHYRVLDAGSVSGEFAEVQSDLAFLTPTLSYSDDAVDLTLTRNDVAFADVAASRNGAHAADSISASATPELYGALVSSNASTAAAGLEQLAGASTASLGNLAQLSTAAVGTALQGALQSVQAQPLLAAGELAPAPALAASQAPGFARQLNDPAAAARVWLQGLGSRGTLQGENGAADLEQRTRGALFGADWALGDAWRLGLAAGYSKSELSAGSAVDGELDSLHLAFYAGRALGANQLRLGLAYSRHDGDSERQVTFGGLDERLHGDYRAHAWQSFVEVGHPLAYGRLQAEPYAGLGYSRYSREGYDESGGSAALRVDGQKDDGIDSSLGVRLAWLHTLDNGHAFVPRLALGWRHRYGDLDVTTRQAFLSGGSAFSVEGSALDRDALLLDAGFDLGLSRRSQLSFGYTGELGSDSHSQALVARWQMAL